MRIDLPDGQWVELEDPRKVSERKRRPYFAAMTAASASAAGLPRDGDGNSDTRFFGPEQQRLYDESIDALVIALAKAWSYDQQITADALLDLPVEAFDVLRRECMKLRDQLLPNFSPSPDPKAPTAGS